MTDQKLTNFFLVYMGQSTYSQEGGSWTVGWCTEDTLDGAKSRKSMRVHYTWHFSTQKQARNAETTAHNKMDKMFGKRSQVLHGLQDMKGEKPNRSDEWWYISNVSQLKTIQNVITKTKQMEIEL
jgi:hypothetical protein